MRNVFETLARRLTTRIPRSTIWLGGALLLTAMILATAPVTWAEDATPPVQDRQVVHRSPSSSSSSGASSRGSASATRGSSSQGAGRTRPGGSGGSHGVAQRPPGSGGSGHRPGYGSGHHHHGYYPYFGGPSFRYYGYFGLGYYGFPFYRPYYYPPVWYYAPVHPTLGGLNLKIKPKSAEVYIDGSWVGRVGAFDGYPGYLWLEKGRHDLVLYHEGYETFHQVVEVRPGVVIKLRDRLVAGVATPPEEIVPPPPRPGERSEQAAEAGPAPPTPGPAVDLGTEPGRLHLTVEPQDASVYLDGRFLGTGRELVGLRAGLMVNPGSHRLSVVRPSYEAEELEIEVVAGQDLDLAVRLEPAS